MAADQQRPLVSSAEELNRMTEWFQDPIRPRDEGPFVLVVDDFYHDPDRIRAIALAQEFVQYAPSPQENTSVSLGRVPILGPASWYSTSLLRIRGRVVAKPFRGFRYAPTEIRQRMSEIVGEVADVETWSESGDWWNGAFHLMNALWTSASASIHHHYKEGDVAPRGWSGVVYLSPNAPPFSGTSIWRAKKTGLCVGAYGAVFEYDPTRFELALLVENRYNRLVLFRESVLHRAESGFGLGLNSRLTQTFFFNSSLTCWVK